MLTEEETVALVIGADYRALRELRLRTDLDPRARMPDGEGLLHYSLRIGRQSAHTLGLLGLALDINGAGVLRYVVRNLLKVLAPYEDERTIKSDEPRDFLRAIGVITWVAEKKKNRHLRPHQLLGITAEAAEEVLDPLRAAALAQPFAEPWDVEYGVGSHRAWLHGALSRSWKEQGRQHDDHSAARARWSPQRAAWIAACLGGRPPPPAGRWLEAARRGAAGR